MQFVRLGADYFPDKMIEGYSSLIWTERHVDLGEFELKSYNVGDMLALLPENTLVSHLETAEVMKVETHSIEMVGEGVDAVPVITVKGKSATSILADRSVWSAYQTKRPMRQAYSATGAACVLLYQAVDNNSGWDVTREGNNAWTTLDDIPNCIVTETVSDEGGAQWFYLEQGLLLPQLSTILAQQGLGIRCLRPVLPNNKIVVTVDSAAATRGTIRRTSTNDVASLCFEIYDGIDRSQSVKFSMLQGHILSPQYVDSIVDQKTVAQAMTGLVDVAEVTRPGEAGLSGWARKVLVFDGGQPETPEPPARPARIKSTATQAQRAAYNNAMDNYIDAYNAYVNNYNTTLNNFRAAVVAQGQAELSLANRTNMFAGDISDLSPYTYKKDYDLGDYVTLNGDYGRVSVMVVHEYVRTEDSSGDRGYPGLVEP